jgi:sulfonate transport system substrate-binding protein
MLFSSWWKIALACAVAATMSPGTRAETPSKLRLDYATYNPVSLVLKDKGWMEAEFARDNIVIEWVQSAGSNKALKSLQNGTVDFGSAAGGAALMARAAGGPVKAIYVFSRSEWTALVVPADSPLRGIADLKGKTVAVTTGTDPHIFVLRALEDAGLSELAIRLMPMQPADGLIAMENGEVDAWAGLDPLMAQSEVTEHARLLFRDPYLNTYGLLCIREDFMAAQPELIQRVLKVYDQARVWALRNPDALRAALAQAEQVDYAVATRQLERTDLRDSAIGQAQARTIQAAGEALQHAGVIAASVDIPKTVGSLIDRRFTPRTTAQR